MNDPGRDWLSRVSKEGPVYLALAAALEAAVRGGELQPGDRLPPQRQVAERLGVDVTTVTRAYGLARERGLVEGTVGRGTFVRGGADEIDAERVDLSMNLPPAPDGVSLAELLRETTADVLARADAATLMAYHSGAGALGQRAAGAAWLAPVLGEVAPERMLLAAGAQAALAASLGMLCRPGDAVVVEPLTYPGIKGVAAQLGLRLAPCAVNGEGLVPAAFDALCRAERPAALYLVPTMQNPTATTMSAERRGELAAVARAHDVWIVEDDPYSRLLFAPPPAVATFAPERTIHIATLAKTLSPGLRLAYVAAPQDLAERLAEALRAVALMPAPLMAAVLTRWVREGQAERLLAGVRREAVARRALAAEILPRASGDAASLHVWLPLPERWGPDRLREAAAARGLSLVTAEVFATGEAWPNGVRISLGAPGRRPVLQKALAAVAGLVGEG